RYLQHVGRAGLGQRAGLHDFRGNVRRIERELPDIAGALDRNAGIARELTQHRPDIRAAQRVAGRGSHADPRIDRRVDDHVQIQYAAELFEHRAQVFLLVVQFDNIIWRWLYRGRLFDKTAELNHTALAVDVGD